MIDPTLNRCVKEIAEELNIPVAQAEKIIVSYYKGVVDTIEDSEPTTVKLDYFGKLSYSEAWKKKVESIVKKKNEVI